MNRAIAAHEEEFPYAQMTNLADTLLKDRNLGIAIYKDDTATPFDYFTIQFWNGRLKLVAHGKSKPEVTWKVPRDYLQGVVDNPGRYIERPKLLDWDRLKDLLGLSK